MRSDHSTIDTFLQARLEEARAIERAAMSWIRDHATGTSDTTTANLAPGHRSGAAQTGAEPHASPDNHLPGDRIDITAGTAAGASLVIAADVDATVGAHLCLWDLERTRWTIRAISRIAEEHRETEGRICQRCAEQDSHPPEPLRWPCPTMRALTWTWSTHPDFEPDWLT